MPRKPASTSALLPLLFGLACAAAPSSSRDGGTYLRWIAFEVPLHETVLLRWPARRMPLRVFLPRPPDGLFESPDAIYDSVRDGVLDWEGVAGPGLPAFVFVDDPGDADIPIVWAAQPDGDWYIAHCIYDIEARSRRFGVARILVTGRWTDARVADLHDVYWTMLHEMGHALGLGGHSPYREDVMYGGAPGTATKGLSPRDRATLRLLYARSIGTRVVGARGD